MPDSIKSIQLIANPSEAGWVFGKIARRLKEVLETRGLNVQIIDEPEGNSDVVFWLYFRYPGILASGVGKYTTRLKSTYVTHVDDSAKLEQIRKLKSDNADLIFMSPAHSLEISSMLALEDPFFSLLIGTDLAENDTKMRIGMFSNCYADGRKNEKWLARLAQEESLKDCDFVFIGTGWKKIGDKLKASGAQVELYDDIHRPYPPYSEFPSFYNSLDLYIYLGFDEGAMGSIDAYVLGTKLLISRQGYHEEFDLDDASFFSNYDEFKGKFVQILNVHRMHQENIKKWSWSNCAENLLKHWEMEFQQRDNIAANEAMDISLQIPTRINPKYRKLYFIFVKRRIQHFFQISFHLRLRPWLRRKYKKFFPS